jgi:hypothetical protein
MAQTKYIDDIIKDIQNTVENRIIQYFLRSNLILPTNYKDYLHTHTQTKIEYWNQFRNSMAIEKTIDILVKRTIDKIVLSDDMQENKDTIEC